MQSEPDAGKAERETVSVQEAAQILGVTHQAVYQAIKRGAIKSTTRTVKVRAIARAELIRYRERAA